MSKEKKGFFAGFKEFIMRGNVIDMAVGVIIAGAFGKITASLVNDVFMPALGYILGDMDLTTKLNLTVVEETVDKVTGEVVTPAVVIGFGSLVSTVIDFLLIALIIFMMIKVFTKTREIAEKKLMKKDEEVVEEVAEDPAPTQEELLTEILAELKKQNAKE